MRWKAMFWIGAFGLLALSPVQLNAQSANDQQSERERDDSSDERHAPKISEYELVWQALETHGCVEFKIAGKDVSLKKMFKDGEEPYFDAFEEKLKPGVYTYQIKFIPNKLTEALQSISDSKQKIKDLWALRMEKLEAGERDAANAIYQEIRELTNTVSESTVEQQSSDDQDYIMKTGQLVVGKNGSIKRFDEQQLAEEAAQREREEKRLNSKREADADDF